MNSVNEVATALEQMKNWATESEKKVIDYVLSTLLKESPEYEYREVRSYHPSSRSSDSQLNEYLKGFIIVGRKNGRSLVLLRRILETAADQAEVDVDMETRTKRAMDELVKRCRYSQKVLRELNESLTLGNTKWNQKN